MHRLQRVVRFAGIAAIAALLFPTMTLASGTASIPDTWVYDYKWEDGTVSRTVTGPLTPGWPVAFSKTDGPRMYMGAQNCSTGADYDINTLADADPPYTYEEVATIAVGTTFCTTWKGRGTIADDTFRGTLAWD